MNKLLTLLKFKYTPILLFILLVLPTIMPLFKPGFFPTQDEIYVARLYQMEKALRDHQFPVRWAADLRYGEPLFNFYAPLIYYLAAFIKIALWAIGLNITYIVTIKIIFILGFFLSLLAMFYLAKELFGVWSGYLVAALYLYAPYHSVDFYVRGALSEGWALIFFPLIFLFTLKLSQKITFKNITWLALSLAGLFYTHNVMSMIFLPFFIIWILYLLRQNRSSKFLIYSLLSLALGLGMAASFILPVLAEKQFIQTNVLTGGYLDFRAHFVALRQLFIPFWGYGASVWGVDDGLSLQIGLAHWFGMVIALLLLSLTIIKLKGKTLMTKLLDLNLSKEELSQKSSLFIFLSFCFLSSLFMMHNKSAFIWEKIPLLSFVQFPWRFLGISIFFASLICGYIILLINQKMKIATLFLLIITTMIFYAGYFRADFHLFDRKDDYYISEKALNREDKLPKDYLPTWVKSVNRGKINRPHFVDGLGSISGYTKKTGSAQFKVVADTAGVIEVPITYFPGWQAKVNQQTVAILSPDDFGLIRIEVPDGKSSISLKFADTTVRKLSNIISFLSLCLIFGLFFKHEKYFEK